MMDHTRRFGNWTSSGVGNLMTYSRDGKGWGADAVRYMRDKAMERRLGRIISSDFNSHPTSWGLLAELHVNEKLDTSYKLCSQETLTNPLYPFHRGTPDFERFIKEKTTGQVKSPWTLLSFCTLIDAWEKGGIEQVRKDHGEGDKFYWQTISDSILTDSQWIELIVYCPYREDLDDIRLIAMQSPPEERSQYSWLDYVYNDQLPYLIKGNHYKDLNILRFPALQADKDALIARIIEAEKFINPEYK